MEGKKINVPWFGLALVLLGAALLFRKLGILEMRLAHIFWVFMMLWGMIGVSRGFTRGRKGRVFGGTVVFLYGLLFLLSSLDSIEIHFYTFLPATFMIFGIAFVMMYLHDLKDWVLLIPAFLLCAGGVLLLLPEFGYYYRWEVWNMLYLYWPVGLILLGVAIIFRCRSQRSKNVSEGSSQTPSITAS